MTPGVVQTENVTKTNQASFKSVLGARLFS